MVGKFFHFLTGDALIRRITYTICFLGTKIFMPTYKIDAKAKNQRQEQEDEHLLIGHGHKYALNLHKK